MDLDKIKQEFALSNRAFNVCQFNSLLTANELILWREMNGSFKSLRNCGYRTANEIDQICDILIERKTTSQDQGYVVVPLQIIFKRYGLSKKSIKACETLGIISSTDLLYNYIVFGGTFHTIYKLKKEIYTELNNLCKSLLQNKAYSSHFQIFYRREIDSLSILKKSILKFTAEQLVSKLSVRAANGLNYLYEKNMDWEDLIWIGIGLGTEKLLNIPNIGAKTSVELEAFFTELIQHYAKIALEDDSNHAKLLNLQIQQEFPKIILSENDLKEIQNSTLCFINFVNEYLPLIFQSLELDFLVNTSRSSIAKKNKISEERVRQIQILTEPKIDKKIKFLWLMLGDYCIESRFNLTVTLISNVAEQHELIPSLKINPELTWRIFSICDFSTSKVILFEELIDREKYSKKEYHRIKLVFNFEARFIVSNCFNILEIKKTLQKVVRDLFILDEDYGSYEMHEQSSLCINIQKILNRCINDQYGLFYKEESLIIFKQKSTTYCFLALSYFKRPQHLDKIYSYILHNDLFIKKPQKSSVRATLIKDPDLFFSIGKTSTYGLISWNTNDQFATKSIKEECILILEKHDSPLHLSQIYSSLKTRRKDVSIKSIRTILEMESEVFDNSQSFYWMVNSKLVFDRPTNHKTAYSSLRRIIEKFKLNVHWCQSYILFKELQCPNYQIEYLIERYLISYNEKLTLKLEFDFFPILKKMDSNQKIVNFLRTKYMLLDFNRRIQFKNKLHSVLQKDSEQLVTKSVVNKIIQFYI